MGQIITIAGTNGSGKSTVVRQLLDKGITVPVEAPGRQTPLGYVLKGLDRVSAPVFIVGAYMYGTGGADTIKRHGIEPVFELIRDKAKDGYSVIYEGAFVMNHTRGPLLVRELLGGRVIKSFHVLLLTTPLEVCFREIGQRREETDFKSPALQRRNIEGNHVRANNYANKMRLAGARVTRVSRETALETLQTILETG